jgi:hypothetical protein
MSEFEFTLTELKLKCDLLCFNQNEGPLCRYYKQEILKMFNVLNVFVNNYDIFAIYQINILDSIITDLKIIDNYLYNLLVDPPNSAFKRFGGKIIFTTEELTKYEETKAILRFRLNANCIMYVDEIHVSCVSEVPNATTVATLIAATEKLEIFIKYYKFLYLDDLNRIIVLYRIIHDVYKYIAQQKDDSLMQTPFEDIFK